MVSTEFSHQPTASSTVKGVRRRAVPETVLQMIGVSLYLFEATRPAAPRCAPPHHSGRWPPPCVRRAGVEPRHTLIPVYFLSCFQFQSKPAALRRGQHATRMCLVRVKVTSACQYGIAPRHQHKGFITRSR